MHCTPILAAMRAAFPSITCLEVTNCALGTLSILAEAVVAFPLCSLVIGYVCSRPYVLEPEGVESVLAACRAAARKAAPLQLQLDIHVYPGIEEIDYSSADIEALAAQSVEAGCGKVEVVFVPVFDDLY